MSNDGVNHGRRRVLTAITSVVGTAGLVGAAVPFVGSWNPSAKAKAAGAPVEVDVSKLEPGQMITVAWQGKPIYVFKRTQETLANLTQVEDQLRDPSSEKSEQPDYAKNQWRSIKKEIAVLLGICTHLGCAPGYRPEVGASDIGSDWLGGFLCPCHGSKFDLAGRVLKGVPAPINLPVPPYKFVSDDLMIIGQDQEA